MHYLCAAVSVEGFIQQPAVSYVARGYFFYVTGWIPARKDPHQVDEKLVARYHIEISRWARARRKLSGLANVQYSGTRTSSCGSPPTGNTGSSKRRG